MQAQDVDRKESSKISLSVIKNELDSEESITLSRILGKSMPSLEFLLGIAQSLLRRRLNDNIVLAYCTVRWSVISHAITSYYITLGIRKNRCLFSLDDGTLCAVRIFSTAEFIARLAVCGRRVRYPYRLSFIVLRLMGRVWNCVPPDSRWSDIQSSAFLSAFGVVGWKYSLPMLGRNTL